MLEIEAWPLLMTTIVLFFAAGLLVVLTLVLVFLKALFVAAMAAAYP